MKNPPTLGKLVKGETERDAIHIAVVPMVAAADLKPGQHVGVNDGHAGPGYSPHVAIVDPFIMGYIPRGETFWLLMYPNTITGLRHEWTHPALPSGTAKSETWLRALAAERKVTYEELVDGAVSGNGACLWGDHYYDVKSPEFWRHVEAVTGKRYDDDHRQNTSWSCSC